MMRSRSKSVRAPIISPAFAKQLNFTGGIRHAAVFFIRRCRREHDIRLQRSLRQEQVMHNQQLHFAAAKADRSIARKRVRSHHIKRAQLSRLRRFDHLRSRQSWLGRQLTSPMLFERCHRSLIVQILNIPGAGQATAPCPLRRASSRNLPAPCSVFCPAISIQTRPGSQLPRPKSPIQIQSPRPIPLPMPASTRPVATPIPASNFLRRSPASAPPQLPAPGQAPRPASLCDRSLISCGSITNSFVPWCRIPDRICQATSGF